MYAGHIAAGLALKAAEPRAPTWALVLGAGWLDIAHGALVLVGVERVRPDPAKFLGWELVDMPWTHSLAAAVAWSVLAALVFYLRAKRAWAVAALVAAMHVSFWPSLSPVRMAGERFSSNSQKL